MRNVPCFERNEFKAVIFKKKLGGAPAQTQNTEEAKPSEGTTLPDNPEKTTVLDNAKPTAAPAPSPARALRLDEVRTTGSIRRYLRSPIGRGSKAWRIHHHKGGGGQWMEDNGNLIFKAVVLKQLSMHNDKEHIPSASNKKFLRKPSAMLLIGTANGGIKAWNADAKRVVCDLSTSRDFPRVKFL
ncbi:hypothetical protein E2562_035722 [Oryza meyeriana var. granulata]|uniref:Uncharacterized protein n=1 Tax=Oryza meyeriana var. granulata TaxID=110450 RepID=A0A6G1E644_9ORYZ|nr:hypothetical protein E2562_035722 [Oryza meyeriana var. granulata]